MLQLGEVKRPHRHGEFRHVADMADLQALGLHRLDILGPGIDKGDVLPGLGHVRPGVAAHRARADDGYSCTHCFSPRLACRGE